MESSVHKHTEEFFKMYSNEVVLSKEKNLSRFTQNLDNISSDEFSIFDDFSYRSPVVNGQQFQGSVSPIIQGRSVREYDEQLTALRKENFNLKLRMYFIEETLPKLQQNAQAQDGSEAAIKELIDTKVELETLRKELQEKQELLKDAAQAINQMEQIQKDTEIKGQELIEELKDKIQCLELEREMDKANTNNLCENSNSATNNDFLQRLQDMESDLKSCQDKLYEYENKHVEFIELLQQRDETIKEYEEKVKEMVFQNAELLETLENKDNQIEIAERSLRGLRTAFAESNDEKQKLITIVKDYQSTIKKKMKSMRQCENQMRSQQTSLCNVEIQRLRDELQTYKSELADKSCALMEIEEKLTKREHSYENACHTIQKLMLNAKKQQDEIMKLKNNQTKPSKQSPTSSKTENIPESDSANNPADDDVHLTHSLSDTEMFKRLCHSERDQYEMEIKERDATIKSLIADIKKKTTKLQKLVNNELWEKNREIEFLTKLIHKTSESEQSSNKCDHLNIQELPNSFTDAEYAKAIETNNLLQRKIDVLIQRLDVERASESVIGKLRKDLRESQAETVAAENWRRECADVCRVLSTRLEELAGFLNSLLKQKDVLGVLASDRCHAMRKAVNRSLDLSKSLNRTLSLSGNSIIDQSLTQLSNLSDLIAEVGDQTFNSHEEPNGNQQSVEKLKAENKALKRELDKRRSAEVKKERRSLPLHVIDNQSESEAWSEPDRKVSLARIGLDEHSTSLTNEQNGTESDSEGLNQSRSSKSRYQERIIQLEQTIAQRDERILEIQCQLVDADNRLKKENLRVMDMNNEIEKLRKQNEELHEDLIKIGAQTQNDSTQLDSILIRELDDKNNILLQIQNDHDNLISEKRQTEKVLSMVKSELENLKMKHKEALANAAQEQQEKLSQLKIHMEKVMEQRLREKDNEHQDALDREWIARAIYEDCTHKLIELQSMYTNSQHTIDALIENEKKLKKVIVEHEQRNRTIQKQLDQCALQISSVVAERTKACSEKLTIEITAKALKEQLDNEKTTQQLMQQRINKLESIQKTLENQINESTKSNQNQSDLASGYTSEDIPRQIPSKSTNRVTTVSAQRVTNSSPDLGIESDAGRISGGDLSHTKHPRLKTCEVDTANKENNNIGAEHPNNDYSVKAPHEQLQSAAVVPSTVNHDCAKVEQENAELRRKLIHTKRAFEDTYQKLRLANQKKAQIEKDIKTQILKTHNVLRNVRSNMENDL